MVSTYSQSSGIDRKSLKRPDEFFSIISGWFEQLAKNSKALMILLGIMIVTGVAAAFFLNHKETRTESARNAYFLATKEMDRELEALAKTMAPASPVEKPATPTSKDKPQKAPETPTAESLSFKVFDVDAKLPETVKKFKAMDEEFQGTRPAFDAEMTLGDLYYRHGQSAKATSWYERAVKNAPGNFEKAMALSALGYSFESAAKPTEALTYYERAINLGEPGIKADTLFAMARCYTALHDSAKAKSTYDQIVTQFPNTDFAKTAQARLAELK